MKDRGRERESEREKGGHECKQSAPNYIYSLFMAINVIWNPLKLNQTRFSKVYVESALCDLKWTLRYLLIPRVVHRFVRIYHSKHGFGEMSKMEIRLQSDIAWNDKWRFSVWKIRYAFIRIQNIKTKILRLIFFRQQIGNVSGEWDRTNDWCRYA